ncbi:hypothetical protein, partial [Lichenibacterium minor]|uniref:hypothetical protein n=1 Tax=Lichenibacterium minor TaxID=2316528 RepID=UPI001A92F7E4
MLDIVSATSASVHALTGSSRPGAVPPLATLDLPTADSDARPAQTARSDLRVIELAERVAARSRPSRWWSLVWCSPRLLTGLRLRCG